jgi:glycosyltransferase involved in cell wall biosynthesis
MKVLIGHPAGNPNAFHAALSYFERGRLAGFVIPWMPGPKTLNALSSVPGFGGYAKRAKRRYFPPIANAPLVEGRAGEWGRMAGRIVMEWRGMGNRSGIISDAANRWVMKKLAAHCGQADAVHAYEDCALGAFLEAGRKNKLCIYDMPIAYFSTWQRMVGDLARRFSDWLPDHFRDNVKPERAQRKEKEMALADLVLAPSEFARQSVLEEFPDKPVSVLGYGTDTLHFRPEEGTTHQGSALRFLYAGHLSLRKGTPLLLDAWKRADVKDAELILAGTWQLADAKRASLPKRVKYKGHLAWDELRARYRAADVLVFPSFFEGYGLVITEAMAAGLPVICTDATAGPEVLDETCGRVFTAGDEEALIAHLRWFGENRERVPQMGRAARHRVEGLTWTRYREQLAETVAEMA